MLEIEQYKENARIAVLLGTVVHGTALVFSEVF